MHIIKDGGVCAPIGFYASAVCADVKGKGKGNEDYTLLTSEVPCRAAAVFTKNRFAAAPVKFCKDVLSKNSTKIQAIAVNSGNANACTGEGGLEACGRLASDIQEQLGFPANSVLGMSTGVIGVPLPVERMLDAHDGLLDGLDSDSGEKFAKAIMTTDTFKKEIAVLIETDNGAYVVAGCAKGAGMIAPDMATMLTFITTDAEVSEKRLQRALDKAMDKSFNSITVDGDMSTNDSVFILANGFSGIVPHGQEFEEAVQFVCTELAKMIVKDGEGATKFVTINVEGAETYEDAEKCAFAIANSPLVKTMFAGSDPNWGRLMSTIGASNVQCEENRVEIYFGELKYVENGLITDPVLEGEAFEIMKKDEVEIKINLNAGDFSKTVYTCDLTREYISINADYRS